MFYANISRFQKLNLILNEWIHFLPYKQYTDIGTKFNQKRYKLHKNLQLCFKLYFVDKLKIS